MKDCNGIELHIGDKVVFSDSRYADLNKGKIYKITPKMVCIFTENEEFYYKYPSSICRVKMIENNNEDFGTILTCAVRYACGRQTYMPSIVIGFIRPLISEIDDKSLCCMERDIRDAEKFGGYGDEKIDKPDWMRFLADLQAEIDKRGIERWI